MAIAAREKRPLRVGDIPSAYLQAELLGFSSSSSMMWEVTMIALSIILVLDIVYLFSS